MKVFGRQAAEAELLAGAQEWLKLLVAGPGDDYQQAWDFLFHPEDEADIWTRSLMKNCIESYGSPFDPPTHTYRVTETSNAKDLIFFIPLSQGQEVGAIEIELPLDGQASDLIAELAVIALDQGLVFRLDNIHNLSQG